MLRSVLAFWPTIDSAELKLSQVTITTKPSRTA
jgi:hypothetical protein